MKNELRRIMIRKQRSLSPDYIKTASMSIQEQILSSSLFRQAHSIFTYISTPQEPSTARIIKTAFNNGKSVYVPRCVGKNMFAVRIYNLNNLVRGKLGILEPSANPTESHGIYKSAEEIRNSCHCSSVEWLYIVPCLSASLDGGRLGHGGGYYDRFLCGNDKDDVRTVCLCFREMLCSDIPMTEHDVYMSLVVTERENI